MIGLLVLPNELLSNIILLIDCFPDLLSFSLINKHVHSLCRARLEEPQALHSQWARINDNYTCQTSLRGLCYDVLENPHIAWYIRVLHLFDSDGELDALNDADEEALRDQILTSRAVPDESRQMWLDAVELLTMEMIDESNTRLTKLLLTLLPRLHTLGFNEIQELRGLLNSLPSSSGMFSSLRNVDIVYNHHQRGTALDSLLECMQLPSLEQLDVSYVLHEDDIFFSVSEGTCPLRKLTMGYCEINPGALTAILQRIRIGGSYGLQEFSYLHYYPVDAWLQFHVDFDGPGLVEALVIHSGTTLTKLKLSVDDPYYAVNHAVGYTELQDGSPVKELITPGGGLKGSNRLGELQANPEMLSGDAIALGGGLKGLNQLRELQVNPEMLVEGWRAWKNEASLIPGSWFGAVDESVTQSLLRDILPRSLEVLNILESSLQVTRIVMEKLVTLLELDFEEVPNLKVLNIGWEPSDLGGDRFIQICTKRGVVWKTKDFNETL
jgi:hypothetical protein